MADEKYEHRCHCGAVIECLANQVCSYDCFPGGFNLAPIQPTSKRAYKVLVGFIYTCWFLYRLFLSRVYRRSFARISAMKVYF